MVLCLAPVGVFAEGKAAKSVTTNSELTDALADDSADTVKLEADIHPNIGETFTVDREVTLDLNGYMMERYGGSRFLMSRTVVTSPSSTADPPWSVSLGLTMMVCGGIVNAAAQRLSAVVLSPAVWTSAAEAVCMCMPAAD